MADEQAEKLKTFMEITCGRYSEDQATQMLVASDYNLEQALQLFCNDDCDEPMIQAPIIEEEVRPAFNIRETRILVEDEENAKTRNLQNVKKRVADNFRDFRTEIEIQEGLANGEPISKRTRLEDIYRPPIEITFHSDFQTAKKVGTNEGKWVTVLVNDETFASLAINRDLFNNSKYPVKETLRQHHIFLRKRFDDPDGAQIMQNYKLSQDSLPVILIVDPRTGEQKYCFKNTSKLTAKRFMQVVRRYKSENRKLVEYEDIIDITDSDDDLDPPSVSFNGCSSRNFIHPSTTTSSSSSSQSKPTISTKTVCLDSDDTDEFESPASSEDEGDEEMVGKGEKSIKIVEAKPKEESSDEEEEVKNDGSQTAIILRLEDGTAHNFRYKSTKSLGALISHIYNKYLIGTGIYNDKKNRMVLFSRVHNCCITTLDSSQDLVQAKLHPSVVIFHNTDRE